VLLLLYYSTLKIIVCFLLPRGFVVNYKKLIVVVFCCKIAIILLSVFVGIFPKFLWKTDSEMPVVRRAIERKESLEQRNIRGGTPLMGAATQGKTAIVKLLLDNGANIEAHASNPEDIILEAGNTALHYACLDGHFETVQLLVKRGAKVVALNKNNNTPLYTVISSDTILDNKEKCIQALFAGKPAQMIRRLFNIQNKQGYTPLMRAAELRDPPLVKLILRNWGGYIDFGLKNEKGYTALTLAEADGADDTLIRSIREAQEKLAGTKR